VRVGSDDSSFSRTHEVKMLTYRKKGVGVFLVTWAVASGRKPRAHTQERLG
jgi:hypothetical protein